MFQHSLDAYDDQTLAELARVWRQRASRGEQEAFGLAHALERELRRRTRASQFQLLESTPAVREVRPWWAFWRSDVASDSNAAQG